MEIIRIPTGQEGVVLRTATELEDVAWLLINRGALSSPFLPNHVKAPDYHRFRAFRKEVENLNPDTLRMGIWDANTFEKAAMVGYVTLKPREDEPGAGEVGCEIAPLFQGEGYATLALKAIMKHGRQDLGYKTMFGEVAPKNTASCHLFESLGFELIGEKNKHLLYKHIPSQNNNT